MDATTTNATTTTTTTTVVNELQDDLDILSYTIYTNLYTQISLIFKVADASAYPSIVDILTKGLERLTADFPWVAGQVVVEGAAEGSTGKFKIKPFERIPRVVVKDLRDEHPELSMAAMEDARFPFSMLDENIIAPRPTLPSGSEDNGPVLLLQVNYIEGGMILTVNGQHNMMDMTGQGQIIALLSKACHGIPFTKEEISSGNLPRLSLVPLLDESYKEGPEVAHQIIKSAPSAPPPDEQSAPNCTWAYFAFDRSSLETVKAKATTALPQGTGFVSTDDALTAFVWQAVMRARVERLKGEEKVSLGRAVDVRRFMAVPATYTGLMQNMTYHSFTLDRLVKEPLGVIAANLRASVDPRTSSLAHDTRALVTTIDRASNKSTVSFMATMELHKDVALSSWAKINCHDLDFNLGLGKPVEVRRPRFTPVESLLYLMPKRLDGEIAVAICLRYADMDKLRVDPDFMNYASYIG